METVRGRVFKRFRMVRAHSLKAEGLTRPRHDTPSQSDHQPTSACHKISGWTETRTVCLPRRTEDTKARPNVASLRLDVRVHTRAVYGRSEIADGVLELSCVVNSAIRGWRRGAWSDRAIPLFLYSSAHVKSRTPTTHVIASTSAYSR